MPSEVAWWVCDLRIRSRTILHIFRIFHRIIHIENVKLRLVESCNMQSFVFGHFSPNISWDTCNFPWCEYTIVTQHTTDGILGYFHLENIYNSVKYLRMELLGYTSKHSIQVICTNLLGLAIIIQFFPRIINIWHFLPFKNLVILLSV